MRVCVGVGWCWDLQRPNRMTAFVGICKVRYLAAGTVRGTDAMCMQGIEMQVRRVTNVMRMQGTMPQCADGWLQALWGCGMLDWE